MNNFQIGTIFGEIILLLLCFGLGYLMIIGLRKIKVWRKGLKKQKQYDTIT